MPAVAESCGFVPAPSNVYWERFCPVDGVRRERPLILLHGSNQTGACYRSRLDGGPGWVEDFAARGYECWIADWPGTGRSGYVPPDRLDFRFLFDALAALVEEIGHVDLVGHSMGGYCSFKLRERLPDRVVRVVGVAPAPPRELSPRSTVLEDDGRFAVVQYPLSVAFRIDRTRQWVPTEEYVERQVIGASTRFPREHTDRLRASLQPIPPLLLLERLNIAPDPELEIVRPESFRGARMLVVTGTADPVHPRAVDEETVAFFRGLGAEADFLWLGDVGIEGNGHLLMCEENSSEIAALIADWLEA